MQVILLYPEPVGTIALQRDCTIGCNSSGCTGKIQVRANCLYRTTSVYNHIFPAAGTGRSR